MVVAVLPKLAEHLEGLRLRRCSKRKEAEVCLLPARGERGSENVLAIERRLLVVLVV